MSKLYDTKIFSAMTTEWFDQYKTNTKAQVKGLAIVMFKRLLEYSPQYSGDFAANWRISLNKVDNHPPEWTGGELMLNLPASQTYAGSPFKAGSRPAINLALTSNARKLDGFELGDTVYFSNNSTHDEPYAWKIENNEIKFRPGNAGAVVERAYAYMVGRYTGQLTPADLRSLSNQRFSTGVYV